MKMKSAMEKFQEDYKAQVKPADNRRGYTVTYKYIGDYYRWIDRSKAPGKRKLCYVLLPFSITLLFAVSGSIRSAVNTAPAVAIAGLISVVSLIFEWIGTVRYCLTKEEMTEKDCRGIYLMLESTTMLTGLFHTLAAAAAAVYLIRSDVPADRMSLLVFFMLAVSSVISFCFHRYNKTLSFEKSREPLIEDDEMPFE